METPYINNQDDNFGDWKHNQATVIHSGIANYFQTFVVSIAAVSLLLCGSTSYILGNHASLGGYLAEAAGTNVPDAFSGKDKALEGGGLSLADRNSSKGLARGRPNKDGEEEEEKAEGKEEDKAKDKGRSKSVGSRWLVWGVHGAFYVPGASEDEEEKGGSKRRRHSLRKRER
jgi:hypothetical protein